jgi:sucrose-6-phosphate hydrolase SacC (GH32 family)
MVSFEEDETEYITNYIKLAARMASFIKNKRGDCLYTLKIKGNGKGFYFSLSDKRFLWIDKGADFYWVDSIKKDEKGRYCLFTPYTFGMGVLLLVPEDEILWVGLN